MKHSVFHKASSVGIALLVLLSTLSFTVDKHFCGDTLVDIALFSDANTCGMEMPSTTKKPCCKDEVNLVKGQDQLKLSLQDLHLDQQQFVAVFFYTYVNLFEGLSEQIIPFKEYSPPNLFYDRQVLHEVFTI